MKYTMKSKGKKKLTRRGSLHLEGMENKKEGEGKWFIFRIAGERGEVGHYPRKRTEKMWKPTLILQLEAEQDPGKVHLETGRERQGRGPIE